MIEASQNLAITAKEVLNGGVTEDPIAQAESTEALPQVDDKISPKLAMLLKREKMAVEREQKAKGYESEWESKRKELEAREAKIREFESLKQTQPLKALELLGLSYEDLTSIKLADGSMPPEIHIKRLEEKLEQEIRTRETLRLQQEDDKIRAQKAKEDEITQGFKTEITDFLSQNSEKYELIQFEGAQELVYEVINEHYERTIDAQTGIGEILKFPEAADKVEKHLERKYNKVGGLKKISALLAAQQGNKEQQKPQYNGQQPKTLTNQMASTPSKPRRSPLTDEERIQKAIAYARGLRT